MDLLQIFAFFCKKNNLYGKIIKVFHKRKLTRYFGYGVSREVTLKEYLNSQSLYFGLQYTMKQLLYDVSYDKTEAESIYRKWSYFVKNNVKISNEPAVGSIVVPKAFQRNFTFTRYDIERCLIYVNNDNFGSFGFNHEQIESINGEPFRPKYYIKQNRKTYGID